MAAARGRPRKDAIEPIMPLAEIAAQLRVDAMAATNLSRSLVKVQEAAGRVEQESLATPLPYGITVPETRRMGSQFMTAEQIAGVFRVPHKVFQDCLTRFPELRHAMEEGAARMLDIATGNIAAAVIAGDQGASRYLLERKGGWTQPSRDSVIAFVPAGGITISGEHVNDVASIQRAMRDASDADLAE